MGPKTKIVTGYTAEEISQSHYAHNINWEVFLKFIVGFFKYLKFGPKNRHHKIPENFLKNRKHTHQRW